MVIDEFPSQRASNAFASFFMLWRHRFPGQSPGGGGGGGGTRVHQPDSVTSKFYICGGD